MNNFTDSLSQDFGAVFFCGIQGGIIGVNNYSVGGDQKDGVLNGLEEIISDALEAEQGGVGLFVWGSRVFVHISCDGAIKRSTAALACLGRRDEVRSVGERVWIMWNPAQYSWICNDLQLCQQRHHSDCIVIFLSGANANNALDGYNENLSIANFAGMGGGFDGLHNQVDLICYDHYLNIYLGDKVNHVFSTTINLGMSFLASVTLYLGDGHPLNANFCQRFFNAVEFKWFYNRLNFFHCVPFLSVALCKGH